ncbi:NF038104 family lipoprotein [Endozoicomonas sp. SM1973]|uniref:NF038104 family lipoprotein n=1 Tax=Spartinivicinus marinus TaxID=2994442 RepID=A0A853IJJ9_9GAMM|nr:NF038104 family lipoprotein [Spartinivicinus marinus]MCX4027703.1 NF038104 family lipoprotein [Spartinivicinus marinus]NYZ69255.1 NF038104 family lipoprotein [Spartinivicinus marinus]
MISKKSVTNILALALVTTLLNGCVSTIIGTAVDATIEVAKVPFKVGGAVIDVVSDDEDEDDD